LIADRASIVHRGARRDLNLSREEDMASKDNHEGGRQGEATQGVSSDAHLDDSQIAAARLTAYVLGELEADQRAAVDRELAASEALRREADEIRQSVERVTAAFAAETLDGPPVPGELEALEKPATLNQASQFMDQERSVFSSPRRGHAIRRRYMLAATLLVVAGAGLLIRSLGQRVEVVAVASRQAGSRLETLSFSEKKSVDAYALAPEPSPMPTKAAYLEFAEEARGKRPVTEPVYETKTRFFAATRGVTAVPVDAVSISPGAEGVRLETPKPDVSEVPRESSGELAFDAESNTESYDRIYENPFLDVRQNPLSTFSVDVDTASYANVRRFLNGGSPPPKDAVRIEELLNYFTYHYAPPADDRPFAVHAELAGCPWEPKHRLLRIALKGREIDLENRPASNLVFLIDVSGSMDDPAKLPLLKNALHLLVDRLGENDRVAMVVYAGSSGLVLPSTSGLYKEPILSALDRLQAGGSTNGGSGIQLAYQVAREKFIKGGTNRVILCTDGDFNVGVTDQGSLIRLIEEEAKSGVFLSVLGFGAGNLKDSTMEKLADRGNGNYAYIDTSNEARKVLVEQLGGTLVTIAKDVKLQLEFNPRKLAAYRLIGYENRLLRAEDFNDDKKDAGEIGAGHTVTALYELVPANGEALISKVDELKYQRTGDVADGAFSDELLTLKLRYKQPEGEKSSLIESVVKDASKGYAQASEDFRFASAVAGFGLLLRGSQFKGDLTWAAVLELAQASRGADEGGYRAEFIELVKKAAAIAGK
jgi:Ca-activated chloride channel family protein